MIIFSAILIVVIGFVIWAALTEFSYFGTGSIRKFYDSIARRYDQKFRSAHYGPEIMRRLWLEPLREAVGSSPAARVLDLACGTGRMTGLLLGEDWFQGSIVAIDQS